MDTEDRVFPPLPEMGQPESYYGRLAKQADKAGDIHARAANKVAQYIASALAPELPWDQKLRYFEHAIKKHAVPPPPLDDQVWNYYQQLQDLVRTHAGQEALRLANAQNDAFTARNDAGEPKYKIRTDAAAFFRQFIHSEECPVWFHLWDFNALRALRNRWA
jgi:hypothetical protein